MVYIKGAFPFISHLLALFNLISDGYKLYTSIAGSTKDAAEEFSFVSSWSGWGIENGIEAPEFSFNSRIYFKWPQIIENNQAERKQQNLGSSLRAQLSRSIEFWVDGIGSKRPQELTQERPEQFLSPPIRASRNIVVKQVIIGCILTSAFARPKS